MPPRAPALVATTLALAALLGCSGVDDRPPAEVGAVPASAPPVDRSEPLDAGNDAGGVPPTCGVAEHTSPDEVDELALNGEPPPPLGGAIAPGTYILSEMNAYLGDAPADDDGPGGGPTGVSGRGTIVVDGDVMRVLRSRVSDGGEASAEGGSFTFEIVGTSLRRTKTCPEASGSDELAFSAVGAGLALFVDARHRELYVRVD